MSLLSIATSILIFIAHRVRLVNGSKPHTGRVEIYTNSTGGLHNAQWGTICDNKWSILNAKVVCHYLGYQYTVGAPKDAHYGQGIGPIWLDNVQCLGNESDIFECAHNGIGKHKCDHNKDASVECSGMPKECSYYY